MHAPLARLQPACAIHLAGVALALFVLAHPAAAAHYRLTQVGGTYDGSQAQPGDTLVLEIALEFTDADAGFDLTQIDTSIVGFGAPGAFTLLGATEPASVGSGVLSPTLPSLALGDIAQVVPVLSQQVGASFQVDGWEALAIPVEQAGVVQQGGTVLLGTVTIGLDGSRGEIRTGRPDNERGTFVVSNTSGLSNDLVQGASFPIGGFGAELVLTKRDVSSSMFGPTWGEPLTYEIQLRNLGDRAASNVVLVDHPDPNTQLIGPEYRIHTSHGVISGNALAQGYVEIEIGPVGPDEIVDVTFEVSILDFPGFFLVNRATVSSSDAMAVASDDPDTLGFDDTLTLLGTAVVIGGTCEERLESCEGSVGTERNLRLEEYRRARRLIEEALENLGAIIRRTGRLLSGGMDVPDGDELADDDGDGVLNVVDACPGSLTAETDALGCSQTQFCASIDVGGPARDAPCNLADWKNDEPVSAKDCKTRHGICVPR